MKRFNKYLELARRMGALDVVLIRSADIEIDPRTYLKCMYGCHTWGKHWTCPSAPGALKPWEFVEIIKRFKYAILIHSDDKNISQKISYELEREAFFDGYYFAFSMSDCAICNNCRYPEDCKHPEKARPAMQALGIDVYATARKQGLPIDTLSERTDKPHWYSLVLIE